MTTHPGPFHSPSGQVPPSTFRYFQAAIQEVRDGLSTEYSQPLASLMTPNSSSRGVPGCRRQFLPIQRRPVQQQPNPVQDITANDPDLGLDLKEATAE